MSKHRHRWLGKMDQRQWLIYLTIGEIAIFGWILLSVLYSALAS
jgi:hypothetical protein